MWYFITGIIGGVLGGMGMGGGTLLIPILTIFLSVSQKEAQGINLVAFVPMAVVALASHFKNGLVRTKGVLYIIVPAVLFGALSSFLARNVANAELHRFFGWFLIGLAALQTVLEFTGKRGK